MTPARKKRIELFINRIKLPTPTVKEMLEYYGTEHGMGYGENPMWRIGYLCAMRDAGRLSWEDWTLLVEVERQKLPWA